MLADLCERIPGGDVDVVTNALGLDQRIGRKYLTGALGYGGPCFPRDNQALGFIARALGARADLAETTDSMNRVRAEKIVERLRGIIRPGTTVAVLGLAYKPFSHVIEESQALYLVRALTRVGARVVAYDPLAGEVARTEIGDQVVILDSVTDCLAQADAVLITSADPAFRRLQASDFTARDVPLTVIDCWRILDKELTGRSNIHYIPIGRSLDEATDTARLRDLWDGAAGGAE
jgi:UDPglucose 6-dehydrogenase